MDQFAAVALAHFLALLIPGVDFFLIVRTAATHGWRSASGTCVGIALSNAAFVIAAFSGLALIENDHVLLAVRAAGGVFLVYVGVAFLRVRIEVPDGAGVATGRSTWAQNFGLGLASGLLNPKNALFYVSLAGVISSASAMQHALYGIWMVTIVLAWDLFIAVGMGTPWAQRALRSALPWITRISGGFIVVFGVGAVLTALLVFT